MRSGRLALSKLAAFADSSTILFRSSRIDDAIEKFEVGTERVVMFAVVKFSNPLELELVESFRNRGGGFPKGIETRLLGFDPDKVQWDRCVMPIHRHIRACARTSICRHIHGQSQTRAHTRVLELVNTLTFGQLAPHVLHQKRFLPHRAQVQERHVTKDWRAWSPNKCLLMVCRSTSGPLCD